MQIFLNNLNLIPTNSLSIVFNQILPNLSFHDFFGLLLFRINHCKFFKNFFVFYCNFFYSSAISKLFFFFSSVLIFPTTLKITVCDSDGIYLKVFKNCVSEINKFFTFYLIIFLHGLCLSLESYCPFSILSYTNKSLKRYIKNKFIYFF